MQLWVGTNTHILSCPLPVDFSVEQVTPIYSVCWHLHIQRHHVLQHGNDPGIVPFHQVYFTDLVAIGEDQVWALAYHRKSAHISLQQLSQGLDSTSVSQTMELSVTDSCVCTEALHHTGSKWRQWQRQCCHTQAPLWSLSTHWCLDNLFC